MKQIKTPNGFHRHIIPMLEKESLIGGETFYEKIAKKLGDENTFGFAENVRKDLDSLVEDGIIARYGLYHPKNLEVNRIVNGSCQEFYYQLVNFK